MAHFIKALVLLVLIVSTPTYAADSCNHTIYGNYQKYPKSYLINNKAHGILIEMFDHIGKKMGCKFSYELAPWKRSYNNMINGRGGIMGLSMSTTRKKLIDYSDVMYYDNLMLVVVKGKEFTYSSMKDLIGKRVISTRGASYGDKWENYRATNKIEVVEDGGKFSQRIKLLLKDRADVAIIGPGVSAVMTTIQNDPFLLKNKDKIVIIKTPFKRDPNYLGFSKKLGQKDFIQRFNIQLNEALNDGTFKSIIKKYEEAERR